VLLAALCCLPFAALVLMAAPNAEWSFSPAIMRFLPDYIVNSLFIALATGALGLFMGSYAAWYVVRYDFPARRILQWALLLPLAMPAYLLAMVYGHLLDVAGPAQAGLRELTGWRVGEYLFPEIRSPIGVVLVLAFSLYPYVYLAARHAFAGQCRSHFEAAWLLGLPPQKWLWSVAMPIARPALALGVALVMMEALADFGVVSLFGVPSFTTGIYRAWYGLGEPHQAARLACMLLALVAGLLWLERASRGRMRAMRAAQSTGAPLKRLRGGLYHSAACAVPMLIGFAIPVVQLLLWAAQDASGWGDALHWRAASHTLLVGGLVAVGALVLALVFAYGLRARPIGWRAGLLRLATLGYAVPGSVIAVAIFIPLLMLDKTIADFWQSQTGVRPALLLTGSIAAMVIACIIRFLAVAMSSVESGLQQISPRIDDAALLLGVRGMRLKRALHLPQMKLALLAGGFMVFADTMKELPASLLLRPFNVSTLSIRTYELASDGQLVAAAIPALMMVAIGLAAVVVLVQVLSREKEGA
jgi:iron(III) transport system permease protein